MFIEIGSIVFVFCFTLFAVIATYILVTTKMAKAYNFKLSDTYLFIATEMLVLATIMYISNQLGFDYTFTIAVSVIFSNIFIPFLHFVKDGIERMLGY